MIHAGIKPENIVYMTYTSIVESEENPWKGMIFTDPASTTDGDWAQYGCFKVADYTDKDISGDLFLAILSGDAEKAAKLTGKENPKVLHAGPEDTVFTYFMDHGGEGSLYINDDEVSAMDVINAIQQAKDKKLYGKWLWFVEACFSGSVFNKLPADWNIFVMTSANEHEMARLTNCPPNDIVAGKELEACIAGLFDNSFLSYYETHPDCTIGEIVDFVQQDVATSSKQGVSQWGDMSFRDFLLSEFIGIVPSHSSMNRKIEETTSIALNEVSEHIAKWKVIRADPSNLEDRVSLLKKEVFQKAKEEIEMKRLARVFFEEKEIVNVLSSYPDEYSQECVHSLTQQLIHQCHHSIPFSVETISLLRNICKNQRTFVSSLFDDICL